MLRAVERLVIELANVYRSTPWWCGIEYTARCLVHVPRVLRERSLRPVDEAMSRRSYCFHVDRGSFSVPVEAFGLAREIIGRRIYELDERFRIRKNDKVLDLGANVGVFSGLAAVLGAHVVAIEAQSRFVPELVENLKLSGLDEKVQAVHGIVAPQAGVFSNGEERRQASHWGEEPPVIDLNRLLEEIGWEEIDLLKIDIEGSEFGLLASKENWLHKVRRIAMEVHTEYGNVDELCARLKSCGFAVVVTDLDKRPIAHLSDKFGYVYAIKN